MTRPKSTSGRWTSSKTCGVTALVLHAILLSACVSIKAVPPESLAPSKKSWTVEPPKRGFLFWGETTNRYRAGPYRTSDVILDVDRNVAAKLAWPKSAVEASKSDQWFSFALEKGKRPVAWVICQRNAKSIEYTKGAMTLSQGSDDKGCEVKTKSSAFRLKFVSSGLDVQALNETRPPFFVRWSTDVDPPQTTSLKSGLQFIKAGKDEPLQSWLKTLPDGEPERLIMSGKTSAQDEVSIVASAFAYLAMQHFACDGHCRD